jgi:hypothetical protein
LDRYQHLQGFSFDNRGGGTFRSTWSTTSTSPGWVEKSDNNGNVTGRSWEPDGTVHTNTFEVNWSFGAALIGGGQMASIGASDFTFDLNFENRTSCENLAKDIQSIFDGLKKDNPNAKDAWFLDPFSKIVRNKLFGDYFSSASAGIPLKTLTNTAANHVSSLITTVSGVELGTIDLNQGTAP